MPTCRRHGWCSLLNVQKDCTLYKRTEIRQKMSEINVTELRQNLPAYLAKVRRGARVRITSRGKVIAEIIPPSADETTAAAARARLRGSVTRYERPFDPVLTADEWDMNR